MAMGPERSKPLHNFTLPRLRWGSQRQLRCMKPNSMAAASSPARDTRFFPSFGSPDNRRIGMESKSIVGGGRDTGIGVVREKLLLDLRAETDRMKNKLFRGGGQQQEEEEEEEEEEEPTATAAAATATATVTAVEEEVAESCAAEARPWNLRTRRAACRATVVVRGNGGDLKAGRAEAGMAGRVLRVNVGGGGGETKAERVKFSVALDRKEIEEDFMNFAGRRPSRRPKKRPRTVQKHLDSLFPGLWLSEITADTYKVQEIADNGKR